MEIIGFRNYLINNKGEVFSKLSNKKLKCLVNTNGYCRLALIDNQGKQSFKYIHRLVAETFIPNPDNKPQVNHIDGDRKNHTVSNLEWVTQSENDLHSFRKLNRLGSFTNKFGLLHPKSIAVTNGIKTYGSISRVVEDGFTASAVCLCIKGIRKQHKGYSWRQI